MFNWFKKSSKNAENNKPITERRNKMVNIKLHGVKEDDAKVMEVKVFKDDKGIVLAAVDKDGKMMANGSIIRLTNEGTLVRLPKLSDKLPVQFNKNGQILEITKGL
jgi:hypothetical protein